ncbi:helix-turn-helix transcriptional regulator [Paraburkholderia antibiotica]|uniref:Helix-turn-helix transcriptional regulator n=1 Tax=Paraburkholderia antibiotica TaxID=2728839 RepID=A0A7Y0A1N3_9BURK|nr:AraC family transcriptional regulator [Paraburkholderia antibiotica]NML34813.1 helix-turn-helix transcriptional regulator [Paraburkholderia antibiotica]
MGKIAVTLHSTLQQALTRREQAGARGGVASRVLAEGADWNVADLLCTFGPRDPSFEERHAGICIAMVVAGSFEYRAAPGRELLTPGALLLGNPGECFECGHRHGPGDRCIAFRYAPGYFERLAADAGFASDLLRGSVGFRRASVPALRSLAPLIARAGAGTNDAGSTRVLGAADRTAWDELAVELAATTLDTLGAHDGKRVRTTSNASATARSRVAQIVRLIDDAPGVPHTLTSLAAAAGVSEFYFLRTFQQVSGVTPHQYLLRARLRAAALRLRNGDEKIVDIALDCGFNDLSNFNHAFRAEFAASPRVWRARGGVLRS